MNDAMSFGIHRIWKDKFMRVLNPLLGTQLLDVAGGTGEESLFTSFLPSAKPKMLNSSSVCE